MWRAPIIKYPDIPRDGEWEAEAKRHINSPQRLCLFRVLWSGTRQYVNEVIRPNGLGAAQEQLAAWKAKLEKNKLRHIRNAEQEMALDSRIAEAKRLQAQVRNDPSEDYRREYVMGEQLKTIVAATQAKESVRSESCAIQNEESALRQAIGRMEAAIILFLREPAPKTPEPPPVTVVMPDEMKMAVTSLPERHTTSEIERDAYGEIITTTQVEKDA